MKRIYVAGSYDAGDVITALGNIKRGIRLGTELLLMGYAPFVPWLDHQLFLQLQEDEHIDYAVIRLYSLAWLPVCEAMVVLPGSGVSKGTIEEIEFAKSNDIPVFLSKEELYDKIKP